LRKFAKKSSEWRKIHEERRKKSKNSQFLSDTISVSTVAIGLWEVQFASSIVEVR
jgi:hypothetical protein